MPRNELPDDSNVPIPRSSVLYRGLMKRNDIGCDEFYRKDKTYGCDFVYKDADGVLRFNIDVREP